MAIRLKPLKPTRSHLIRLSVAYRLIGSVVNVLFRPLLRLDIHGAEHVPRKGPILVLANHVGFLDPFVVCIATRRMVQFMATPTLFTRPILGPIAKFFGVVPKRKFYADLSAIFRMVEWARLGSAVGLFPEGQRTWDAHTLDVVPGIGKFVRLIDAPVVILRMYNMDRVSPRWAKTQRSGRIIVEIDKPIRFDRRMDPTSIEADIQKRISVDPLKSPKSVTYGTNLAGGIRNVLFLCPACRAHESLAEDINSVRCRSCGAEWLIDANNRMTRTDTGESTHLVTVLDEIKAFLEGQNWTIDPERFAREGIALESKPMELYEISGRRPRLIGRGVLRLTNNGLELFGDAKWSVSFKNLLVATVDLTTDLQFRTTTGLYSAVMKEESVVKWEWFVNPWLAATRDTAAAST